MLQVRSIVVVPPLLKLPQLCALPPFGTMHLNRSVNSIVISNWPRLQYRLPRAHCCPGPAVWAQLCGALRLLLRCFNLLHGVVCTIMPCHVGQLLAATRPGSTAGVARRIKRHSTGPLYNLVIFCVRITLNPPICPGKASIGPVAATRATRRARHAQISHAAIRMELAAVGAVVTFCPRLHPTTSWYAIRRFPTSIEPSGRQ